MKQKYTPQEKKIIKKAIIIVAYYFATIFSVILAITFKTRLLEIISATLIIIADLVVIGGMGLGRPFWDVEPNKKQIKH